MEEQVILVDEQDNVLGEMPKMEAHEKGVLHRAISVFIFNEQGEMMIQRRALSKYHSPGLWSNTCCTHPRLGETNEAAGERRLQEEMGFTVPLQEKFSFIYKAAFGNGLIEHELDYVLIGQSEETPVLNPEEVCEWKWINLAELKSVIGSNPEDFTFWFKDLMGQHSGRF